MSAPKDNNYASKFPTPQSRKQLCADYILHVESGLSDECFPLCDPQTLHKYMERFPEDFDTDALDAAQRTRQLFWEKAGRDGTLGQIEGFNASSWKFNMQNRFGWREKHEGDLTVKSDPAQKLMEAVIGGSAPEDQA